MRCSAAATPTISVRAAHEQAAGRVGLHGDVLRAQQLGEPLGVPGAHARDRAVLAAEHLSSGPLPRSTPCEITTTSSTLWATSDSRWLDTSTARPRAACSRSSPRIQRMPGGSRPLVGSSRISTSGSPSSAAAIARRWRMPIE